MAHSNGGNAWGSYGGSNGYSGGSQEGRGKGNNGRSRSPPGPLGVLNGISISSSATPVPKGTAVQFFHEGNPADKGALLVQCGSKQHSGKGPLLLQSHGWFDGVLHEDFDPKKYDAKLNSTWPFVMPAQSVHFVDKTGWGKRGGAKPQRARLVRNTTTKPPALSLAFVRWAGPHAAWMDDEEPNDGDWGKYGSPASDEYMDALTRLGILAHPKLEKDEEGVEANVQVFQLYVHSSSDMWEIIQQAPWISGQMKGKKRTCFWMLWPAEWEDTGDPDFACYIERHAMFMAMRALEGIGLATGFPHPADQYELITSKSWMATLSPVPAAHLPAAVLVSKGSAVRNLELAAQQALNGMHHIKKMNPYPVEAGEPAAPSEINKNGITKGVVKLGWSWENRFVLTFNSQTQLQARLKELLNVEGCTAVTALVQEWVDFDFEMRYYFLPPGDWLPSGDTPLQPTKIECNEWGERDEKGSAGTSRASFSKLSETGVLKKWEGDEAAWEDGKKKATEIAHFLLAWLISANSSPIPMIRLDFMMKRVGPGKARVYFGEYCEMGACCLGWVEGPPTIWRAAIDAAMR